MGETTEKTNPDLLGSRGAPACKSEPCTQHHVIDIGAIYCKHYRQVLGWCTRMVRNNEDAQDLTQDVFLQVMRKIHTFRGESSLSTWLYRVAINTVQMWLRRKRLPQSSLEEALSSGEGVLWRARGLDAAKMNGQRPIARIDLGRAIGQLPTGFKAAVLLHDLEQYRHREIAEMLDLSVGTSKSQLHKARRRLRELL